MAEISKKEDCRLDPNPNEGLPRELREEVGRMAATCQTGGCFDHISQLPIPSRESVVEIVELGRRVLFPGYFTPERIDPVGLEYHLGGLVIQLYKLLSTQVAWAVRHDCHRYEQACSHCQEEGGRVALEFIRALPDLRAILATDTRAAYEGDPAGSSYDEIIFSYPGLYAITVQRMAHRLWQAEVPLLPRIMTEHAHSKTGIDIHPGATIGESFFIDHGTGVVIGETAEIGQRVRLYQGVTLGALSLSRDKVEELRNHKRHPTIGDDVIIYAGATILGGRTVVGEGSIIGGNVWITESVPPKTKVLLKAPEQVVIDRGE